MILLKLCQIVVCTYLDADVTSIIYQHKDVTKIEDFANAWHSFAPNKLSNQFW